MTASQYSSALPHRQGSSGKKVSMFKQRRMFAWIFVAPALMLMTLVAAWPLTRTLLFSFTDASLDNLDHYSWVGFINYLDFFDGMAFGVLADQLWWQAVWNTLKFTFTSVSLELFFGTLVALLMNQSFKGRGLLRAAVLIPWAIPTVVSAKMWSWLFHDQYGMINDILFRIGIISEPLAWIGDPVLSMWAVVIADVWKTTPFMALMILAALQMVPKDVYEAAKVDGVKPVQTFFRITLPLIRPALLVALIFRTLDAMRVFDLIYLLTANSEATMSVSGYARQQLIDFQDVGSGSAASVLVFMLVAGTAISYLYFGKMKLEGTEDE